VNKRIPQFPVEPDFIIPVLSKDQKKLCLFVIECKADKIIKRDVFDQIPPRVEYSLTAKGKSLSDVLEMMARWGAEH
jgi:DNA-binding HxlR family transcriptional regulator